VSVSHPFMHPLLLQKKLKVLFLTIVLSLNRSNSLSKVGVLGTDKS
jgi:hypothetical protein